jgi:hypothetical protein
MSDRLDENKNEYVDEKTGEIIDGAQLDYDKVAVEEPPREVDVPPDPTATGNDGQSLSGRMNNLSDLSDMQTYLLRLFPQEINNDAASIDNLMMVSRISPEIFLAAMHLMVEEEIMTSDPKKAISVNNIIMKKYGILSIGDLGKGRIDIEELAGAVREEKKLENALKGM